ncbi:MAG: translation initiation factor IF-3 [Bacteroidetes bacterium]|nr:translation initiation factor IF-3 [Bacteroidota bacterium]MBT5529532.1 translation initiation factor IF-3 [Cytophagia bacterium]MBT3422857.1 translation initiation factor IF-3 [Bacteroidota bacterium]MBT3801940.1 translation initiation factor IF-3 [Bacteroidota bacterium]MBT3935707.1 translation initiation factor IF-3 [Bacteroidota bacterium]
MNSEIRAPRVRVVGANVEEGIFTKEEALAKAIELELDLVEIFGKGEVPVCKIIDFSKFIYEQKKKQKEIKTKSAKTVLKEIRFGPNTDEHDFQFKLNHARKFLEEGAKIKAYVHFKGRTIVYKERGEILLLKFIKELEEVGKVDQLPKMEGKRMIVMLNPLKTK